MSIITTIVDTSFSIGLFLNAILMIPQIIKLFRAKNSKDFSLLSYIGFDVFLLGMTLHGLVKYDLILISGMSIGFILNTIMIGAIIVFKKQKTI